MPKTVHNTKPATPIIGGVDTHSNTHTVAALDLVGRRLGWAQFPANRAGYQQLTRWLTSHGPVQAVGVEGTGSYGAGLTRFLSAAQIKVVEVNRPNRADRRRRGKSDPIDAEQAAMSVLNHTATAAPKTRTGPVESIRMVHDTRDGAVKARTAAVNTFLNLLRTSPDEVRDPMIQLTRAQQLRTARSWRTPCSTDPHDAAKKCLRSLADRINYLSHEIADADKELRALTTTIAPQLTEKIGVGPETAAQLLITAGDNPDRITSEAAFAALCGASPVKASSGKTTRHRLNRGGDRQANRALHMITLTRLRCHPATRDYIDNRGGETTPHLIRCLKRSLARELFPLLTPTGSSAAAPTAGAQPRSTPRPNPTTHPGLTAASTGTPSPAEETAPRQT